MNKDKVIKDLRERNDKLQSQYYMAQSRCWYAENKNEKLIKKIKKIRDYVANEDISRFNNPTIEFALNIRKEKLLEILDKENK